MKTECEVHTRLKAAYGGRMPAVDHVAVGTLHEYGTLAEALDEHLAADVVETETATDQVATLHTLDRAIDVGERAEAIAIGARRVHVAVDAHVRLRGVIGLAHMLIELVVGDRAPEGRLNVLDCRQASVLIVMR